MKKINIFKKTLTLKLFISFLLVFMCLNILTGLNAQTELNKALKSRDNFLNSQEKQKTRRNWLNLIKEFETAADKEKASINASKARFFAADFALKSAEKFKQKEDFQKAISLAKIIIEKCPKCPDAASAQFIMAKAYYELQEKQKATQELKKLKNNYPSSIKISEANKLLNLLEPATSKNTVSNSKKDTNKNAVSSSKTSASIPKPPQVRADKRPQIYFAKTEEKNQDTIITVYLDKESSYLHNILALSNNNYRIYVDFTQAILLPKTGQNLNKKTNLINLSKINQHSPKNVRLVIDIKQKLPYQIKSLSNPPRLEITVSQTKSTNKTQTAKDKPLTHGAKNIESNKTASLSRQLGLKVNNIVIDPGHGGKDTGTLKNGLKEKDITLKVAKLVQKKLQSKVKANIHLTRSTDVFLTLERRTKIAKDKKADIFISLHVNAHNNENISGFEAYTLNLATDSSAMQVAARENASANKNISEMSYIIKKIIQTSKKNESKVLAASVQQATIKKLRTKYAIKNLGLKEAPFFVLISTEVPSILIEMGFITNKTDFKNLNNEQYLDLMATGISEGLINYYQGL